MSGLVYCPIPLIIHECEADGKSCNLASFGRVHHTSLVKVVQKHTIQFHDLRCNLEQHCLSVNIFLFLPLPQDRTCNTQTKMHTVTQKFSCTYLSSHATVKILTSFSDALNQKQTMVVVSCHHLLHATINEIFMGVAFTFE